MGKGAPLCLNGAFSLSLWGPYSDGGTAKFSPVNLPHCPWRGTVKGSGIRGAGGRLLPQKFPHPKSAPLVSKSVIFKVKHAPSLFRKMTDFLKMFVPNCVLFFAHYGAQLYREGTKLARGHLYALMGHLALHIATTEPGNCPRESLFCPWWGTVV